MGTDYMLCDAPVIPFQWIDGQGGYPISAFPVASLWHAFDEGTPVEETAYYRNLAAYGAIGPWRDHLASLRAMHSTNRRPWVEEPLPAVLTAAGRYRLQDGHHRAGLDLMAGRTGIPVRVVHTSPTWQHLVSQLGSIYPGRPRKLYQGIEHPHFDGWTIDRSNDRLGILTEAVRSRGLQGRSFVEIGCCTGRVSREMLRLGMATYGCDIDPRVIAVAEHLGMVMQTATNVFHLGAELFLDLIGGTAYGASCVLSVYHRYPDLSEASRVLRRLIGQSRLTLTDMADPADPSLADAAMPRDESRWRDWIHGLVPHVEITRIGETEGRALYAIDNPAIP